MSTFEDSPWKVVRHAPTEAVIINETYGGRRIIAHHSLRPVTGPTLAPVFLETPLETGHD